MASSPLRDAVTCLLVILFMPCLSLLALGSIVLPVYLLFTSYWWLGVLILSWTVYDRKTGQNGGRRIDFVYRNFFPLYLEKEYFDMKIIKMADLDPGKNYIVGYHPHGNTIGLAANFLSPFTGFEELFPGLTPYFAVLTPIITVFPVIRELALALGAVDCGKESFHSLLHQRKGVALGIAVGGSVEVYDMHPGMMRLTLKRRKGFVRMALKYGASLVPVLAFGDNDVFDQLLPNPPGSAIRRLQEFIYRKTGCCLLMQPWGRYGFLPYRTPIHCVVGRPLDVTRVIEPTTEQVDDLHALYVSQLEQLFDGHKDKFPGGDKLVLEIV